MSDTQSGLICHNCEACPNRGQPVGYTRDCRLLAFVRLKSDGLIMTQKRLVLEAISDLPDEASLEEIAARVEFLAAIQKGLDQLDRGEGIPHEEVKRQLATKS